MSEELLQRDLWKNPEKINHWDFYNIGATTVKALKEYGIIRNIDYGDVEKKKVDGIIVQNKKVIAIVEYKKPSDFKTKKQQDKAIKQELKVAQKLKCKLIIATDTKKSIWLNVLTGNRIKDEDGNFIIANFDPKDEKISLLIEKINYSINEISDFLKPKQLVNPTDLAKQIWQDIWSVSGATPENCLYTFVELFIFKYLSDLGVLQGIYSFDFLIKNFDSNNPEDILENYASIIRPKIKELFHENPVDKTTIINGTIFVSKDQKAVKGYSTVFKKVLLRFRDYGKLEHIDYDFKSKLFESFLKESISKKNWGQFFTPLRVVRAIVEMAKDEIKPGIKICDPACGVGKFLLEPIKSNLDQFYEVKRNKVKSKITIRGFDKGFDRDEQKTIILAKANMLIYFSDIIKDNPNITPEFADLFNESFLLKTNSILGTLSDPVEDEYDLILTNPPYVTSGSSNLKDEIKKDGELVNYYRINAMGVEGLFLEWIVRALKPGGKAFVVVPDGILNRQNDKNIRQFLIDECYIDAIISLPIKTFFTTPKKTYILCITKKSNKKIKQSYPIFTYLVSEIGESRDVYRFEIEKNDLEEAVTLFNFFKGNKKDFSKINRDPRCKIQPFEKLIPENHWSVDRWWSNQEQIDLGIIEENNSITIEAFSDLVYDISETLNDYSGLLKEVDQKKKNITNWLEVALSNNTYFDLFIGKRLLKKDLINISGDIPIYSANVKIPISYNNHSNIDNFKNNFVIWGIDGDFEFNSIPKHKPFTTTDHCGTIRIKMDLILPEYLMIQLQNVKSKYGYDRGLRASLKNMRHVSVLLPIDEQGNLDIEKQNEIIEKYNFIVEVKSKIKNYLDELNKIGIEITTAYQYINYNINKIFDFQDGYSFPSNVYTTKLTDIKLIRIQDVNQISKPKTVRIPRNYEFPNKNKYLIKIGDYLLSLSGVGGFNLIRWNGEAGYLNQRVSKISIKQDLIKNFIIGYEEILIDQIYNQLNSLGKGANNNLNKSEIFKIEINVPVDKNNNIDLIAQKEILDKFMKIKQIRSNIIIALENMTKVEIELK